MSILGFIALVLPLVIVMLVNKNVYFKTHSSSITIGFIIIAIILALQIKGYTKQFKTIVWLFIIELLLICFKTLLGDLILLVGMALLGQVIYKPFEILKNRYERLYKAYETANINGEIQRNNIDYYNSIKNNTETDTTDTTTTETTIGRV
jgi:hypothetical protein